MEFAGLLPPGSICQTGRHDASGIQGVISSSGFIECQDCLLGIRRFTSPLPKPRVIDHPTAEYLIASDGKVKITCGICHEPELLSRCDQVLVGKFILTYAEEWLGKYDEDGMKVIIMIPKPVPRVWKVQACPPCRDIWRASVRMNQQKRQSKGLPPSNQPFMKM